MAAMTRETRRIVVAHLTERRMPLADIADELGVSIDTVRRDLTKPPEPAPTDATEDAAPDAAPPAPALALADEPQLRKDLNVLAAAHKMPAEDAVRTLIHAAAEDVRATWTAYWARQA